MLHLSVCGTYLCVVRVCPCTCVHISVQTQGRCQETSSTDLLHLIHPGRIARLDTELAEMVGLQTSLLLALVIYPQNHLFSPLIVILLGMPSPGDSVHHCSTPSFGSYVLSTLSAALEEVVKMFRSGLSIKIIKPLILSTFFLSFRLDYFC